MTTSSVHTQVGGLPLLLVQRAWPPVVHLRIRLPSGALADPAARLGTAALCWRAALRAAGGRGQAAQARALEALGVRFDAHVGLRETVVEATLLADQLEPSLALIADALFRPRLADEDVDDARQRQLADLQSKRDDDDTLADEGLFRFLHRGQPEGRPVEGIPATLARINRRHCRAAHKRALAAGPVQLGLAGPLSPKAAAALVRRHLAPLLKRRVAVPQSAVAAPRVSGRRLLVLDHPGRQQATVVLGLPTLGAGSPDLIAMRLADAVVGGAFTSRLNYRIREQRGWTYSLMSALRTTRARGVWTVSWTPAREVAARSLDLAMRVVELAAKDGVTAKELTFGAGFLTGGLRYETETVEAELDLRMRTWALGLGQRWIDRYPAAVRQLTRKQVGAAMKRHLDPSRAVVVVVGDARTLVPAFRAGRAGFAVEVMPLHGAPERATVKGNPLAVTPGPTPEASADDREDGGGPDLDAPAAAGPAAGATPTTAPDAAAPGGDAAPQAPR